MGGDVPAICGVKQMPASQTSDKHCSFESHVAPSSPLMSISMPIVGFTAGVVMLVDAGSQKVSNT